MNRWLAAGCGALWLIVFGYTKESRMMYGPLLRRVGGGPARFCSAIGPASVQNRRGGEAGGRAFAGDERKIPTCGESPVLPVFAPPFAQGSGIGKSSSKGEDACR